MSLQIDVQVQQDNGTWEYYGYLPSPWDFLPALGEQHHNAPFDPGSKTCNYYQLPKFMDFDAPTLFRGFASAMLNYSTPDDFKNGIDDLNRFIGYDENDAHSFLLRVFALQKTGKKFRLTVNA